MAYLWCESCDKRWEGEEKVCPECSSTEVRVTVSEEVARERGII